MYAIILKRWPQSLSKLYQWYATAPMKINNKAQYASRCLLKKCKSLEAWFTTWISIGLPNNMPAIT